MARTPRLRICGPEELTPVEKHGGVWLKRDDLCEVGGQRGGKVRTCYGLAVAALDSGYTELVTAGSQHSPQCHIVAGMGKLLGMPVTLHVPSGELGDEIKAAQALGATVIQHRPGYNSVIVARARESADASRFYIPFKMECQEAVDRTAEQVRNLPDDIETIVIPVGSGMSAAGVVTGAMRAFRTVKIIGVVVGADPTSRLDKYAPKGWRDVMTLVPAGVDYGKAVEGVTIGGVSLDPIYEAKCFPFLQPGQVLWIVGHRGTGAVVEEGDAGVEFLPLDDADPEEAPAVWRLFTDLDEWDDNPRDNDEAAEIVADLMILYGFGSPMAAWPDPAKGGRLRIIAGHTRKKAVAIVAARYRAATPDGLVEIHKTWHAGAVQIARTGKVPVRIRADLTREQANELSLADNKANELAQWNQGKLAGLLQHLPDGRALQLGWDQTELSRLLRGPVEADATVEKAVVTLVERFTVPPFSVLDARQGYWKERKKAWIDLGLKSYLGRENMPTKNATFGTAAIVADVALNGKTSTRPPKPPKGILPSARRVDALGNIVAVGQPGRPTRGDALGKPLDSSEIQTTLSIFDPVLAELAYRWFAGPGATVLDPFSGGSVRGLVAQRLGLRYYGIDLRPEQVEANQNQAKQIGHRFASDTGSVDWILGDSDQVLDRASEVPEQVDLVFSCPPYMDLETYSEDPADISVMSPSAFWKVYRSIIAKACARLADNRFAVWVVGEVRNSKAAGAYHGFVPGTIQAFADAGLTYYNEGILVTSLNSVPLRAAKHFTAGRKLCRTHQTVLVFLKGDPKAAVAACGDISHCMPDDLAQFVDGDTDGD